MRTLAVALTFLVASTTAAAAEQQRSPQDPQGEGTADVPASPPERGAQSSTSSTFTVESSGVPLSGLLPSNAGGLRIVDNRTGDEVSPAEVFEALGRKDLAEDFRNRVIARWLYAGAAGVFGLGGAAALGVAVAAATLGAPAGLPWTAPGLVAVGVGVGLTGLMASATVGAIAVLVDPLPVDPAELTALATGVGHSTGE